MGKSQKNFLNLPSKSRKKIVKPENFDHDQVFGGGNSPVLLLVAMKIGPAGENENPHHPRGYQNPKKKFEVKNRMFTTSTGGPVVTNQPTEKMHTFKTLHHSKYPTRTIWFGFKINTPKLKLGNPYIDPCTKLYILPSIPPL